ncbi:MAG: ribosome assembly cofactor RimP [Bacteroidaceae bacterium]|nr:ribosome assembly cofactor RimP [Bacteroidaceae bacterium]
MIETKVVTDLAERWLEGKEKYFLVDVSVSRDNRIVVEIDHPDGVWIDDCVELSRFIEGALDRDVEDYELEVGSAGIGQPFKVLQQYLNHIGQEVEVLPRTGAKLKGTLLSADNDGIVLKTKVKQTVEGRKRPVMADVEIPFRYEEINYTKHIISLK